MKMEAEKTNTTSEQHALQPVLQLFLQGYVAEKHGNKVGKRFHRQLRLPMPRAMLESPIKVWRVGKSLPVAPLGNGTIHAGSTSRLLHG